ncbi:MAG: acetyl-CoA carboxylase biotin carboxyl carrier protein [Candidatus Bipolaricaulota bacterium]|nr:MAG: acetyl-CoA carboxylase biotin carboxyl carrier protein [Candidatus Bipolaricaulota bacterium]
MDFEALKKIIDLLKRERLTEITVVEGNEQITVRQEATASPLGVEPGREEGTVLDLPDGQFVHEAPLVGTFYRRRAPDDPALVDVGDRVNAGDTLCVIEAMKVMNEIAAERAGLLQEILVEDGASVEFGQPLFRFEAL